MILVHADRDMRKLFYGSQYQMARDNLNACGHDDVRLLKADAIAAASEFGDNDVDFLFIDDLHEPNHVRLELDAWLPKMRRPTWIAGDDFSLVKGALIGRFQALVHQAGWWRVALP